MNQQPGRVRMDSSLHVRAENGFTLTDLLVVIALVAVLGLLFIPAHATTGRNADVMLCKANLLQTARAIDMYAKDYGGSLPGPIWSGIYYDYKNGDTGKIGKFLAPYLGLPAQDNTRREVDVLKCPASFEARPSAGSTGLNQPICFLSTFTITNWPPPNLQTTNYPFGRPNSPTVTPQKLSAIKRPSENWAMTDADQQNVQSAATYFPYLPSKAVHSRRPGPPTPTVWRNYLFFDWSVRFVETPN